MAEGDEGDVQPPHKKRRIVTGRSTNSFLRSWAWKREHSVRFEQAYVHTLRVPGEAADQTLSIRQAPFNAEGFASTVWDSSIVVAKFLEKQAALAAAAGSSSNTGARDRSSAASSPADEPAAEEDAAAPATGSAAAAGGATAAQRHAQCEHSEARADTAERLDAAGTSAPVAEPPAVAAELQQSAAHALPGAQHSGAGLSLRGRRCLDLSAGCGLVGIVMALLGGRVTATDLSPNLPLLRTNCAVNGVDQGEKAVRVLEHEWGTDAAVLGPAFDVIVACDVMYIDDAVQPLVQTLAAVSDDSTRIYIAHGRNRQAEASFLAVAREDFDISELPSDQLDDVYQCSDVAVWLLKRRMPLSQP